MATVGYDNSVRIWDMNEMNVINIIEDRTSKGEKDCQINALAWQPIIQTPGEEILVIGTAGGYVKIIDVKRNKVVQKIQVT